MIARVRRGWVSLRSDRMLTNSALLFGTSLLMAGFGAAFWVLAARLHPPETVGLAGSLVAASDTLALFAQLGLNIALVRTMPRSDRPAADVLASAVAVGSAGAVLALGYVVLLPVTAPALHAVVDSPWTWAIFVVLVAATAVNVLSDSVFLALDRVLPYVWLNGLLLGLAKLTLPLLLAGAGVMGLYGSVGGAALLCGVASVVVILRGLPRPTSLRPSRALLEARGFAGASYVTYVLTLLPQMVLPLIVINQQGPRVGAFFFVSAQIVTVQNAVILAVGNSMYAEAERHPHRRTAAVRRGGLTLGVVGLAGAVPVLLLAPWLLAVFGAEYADQGTDVLRLLSLGVLGLAFNFWVAMRLRIAHRPGAMVLAQAVTATLVLSLSVLAAFHSAEAVAVTWGVGQLLGGLVGFGISRFLAPLTDAAAPLDGEPVEAARGQDAR